MDRAETPRVGRVNNSKEEQLFFRSAISALTRLHIDSP
jgi:hypothetical protein